MKWKAALFTFGVMMLTVGTPVSGVTAGTGSDSGGHIGKNIALGPVCFPGDPCGLGKTTVTVGGLTCTTNGSCDSGKVRLAAGPVCYPNEPCGLGGKIVVAGPTCTPNGPCGSGTVGLALGPVCYPNEPCGLGGKIIPIGNFCTFNGPCDDEGNKA
jgi:hypothetical protein